MSKAMHPMQALLDGMSAQWQRERAETQMTLGKMIDALAAMPAGAQVANLCSAHSYRGYYRDLAFNHRQGTRSAIGLLDDCRAAMGRVFEGYKGGDYVMGARTPVWVASYGSSGERLMGFAPDGAIETAPEDDL